MLDARCLDEQSMDEFNPICFGLNVSEIRVVRGKEYAVQVDSNATNLFRICGWRSRKIRQITRLVLTGSRRTEICVSHKIGRIISRGSASKESSRRTSMH